MLEPGEHAEDVLAGAVAIALRRAAIFGRAPVTADIELALELFKYLVGDEGTWPTSELVAVAPRAVRRCGARLLAPQRRSPTRSRSRPFGSSRATVVERLEAEPGSWSQLVGA